VTFERGLSLAAAVGTGAVLAYGSGGDRRRIATFLYGIAAGGVLVAIASVLVLAADRSTAAPGSRSEILSRFQGFGERPTTDAMLYALALPTAALLVVRAGSRAARIAGVASVVLLDALLVASGSRGPEVAALLALAVLGAGLSWRGRLYVGGAIAATVIAALAINLAQTSSPASAAAPSGPAQQQPRYPSPGALAQELGHQGGGVIRSLFGTSGRTDAWRGALDKANERPTVGFGFGTEDRVFEDHYYAYQGSLVSSSWIGMYLQLGAFGVAAFFVFWALLVAAGVSALRRLRADAVAVACAAVTAAALPLSFVESWIYSIGNVASLPFWIGSMLLAGVVWGSARGA
jgi:hypothetical protein